MDGESIIGLLVMIALWLFNGMRKKQAADKKNIDNEESLRMAFEEEAQLDFVEVEPVEVPVPEKTKSVFRSTQLNPVRGRNEKKQSIENQSIDTILSLDEQEDSEESDFEFNARDAIIYSEIMNRPYR